MSLAYLTNPNDFTIYCETLNATNLIVENEVIENLQVIDLTSPAATPLTIIPGNGQVNVTGNLTATGNLLAANLSGTNTGDVTIASLPGATPNPQGISISGQQIQLQPASALRSWFCINWNTNIWRK